MQFVIAPEWLISHVRNSLDRWILPLWRSLPLDVLSLPKSRGGFQIALRDPELVNISAILSRSEGDHSPLPLREYNYYDQHSWLSPEYNLFRATTFLESLEDSPPPEGWKHDGSFYQRLITATDEVPRWADKNIALPKREFIPFLRGLKMDDCKRLFLISAMNNALPFQSRLRWRKRDVPEEVPLLYGGRHPPTLPGSRMPSHRGNNCRLFAGVPPPSLARGPKN